MSLKNIGVLNATKIVEESFKVVLDLTAPCDLTPSIVRMIEQRITKAFQKASHDTVDELHEAKIREAKAIVGGNCSYEASVYFSTVGAARNFLSRCNILD